MSARILNIHPENPQSRLIQEAVSILEGGGLVIYPTDTIYGMGCDATNARAIEKLCRVKGIKPKNAKFAIICEDLSHISEYAKIDNATFKLMKKVLPGPFTFILRANQGVAKLLNPKKKEVGIRIPDHAVTLALVQSLGRPLVTTSLRSEDEEDAQEYLSDPEEIIDTFANRVDLIIDSGAGLLEPSTILKCDGDEVELFREGLGDIASFL